MTTALHRGCDDFPDLIGRQEPEWSLRSESVDFLHGDRCVEFFEWAAKVRMFPWQADEVRQANACGADGRWTHKDHCIICARQNGKSFVVEAILLYRLFALGQQVVFTAQRWPTAQSIRNRLWGRIKSNKKLTARIVRNVNSQGMAEIELDSGAKVQFSTRSADSGRGFDKIDLVIFDESYNLDDADIDAMLPIQLKAGDPQTIYLSTPVNREIHSFGEKLSELRRRVHTDRPSGWAWSEYAAPEGADRDAVETWALANPSLRSGPEVDTIRKVHGSMSETSFDVEILGRGLWFEDRSAEDDPVVSLTAWDELVDLEVRSAGQSCLAVECEPSRGGDGRVWSIGAAVDTETGTHLQLGVHEAMSPAEVVDRVAQFVAGNDPVAVVMDAKSVARDLIADRLIKAGVEPEYVTAPLVSATTNGFLQAVDDASITHDGDPDVRAGLEAAQLREIGDAGGVAWSRKSGGQVSHLIALSYALWGLDRFRPEPAAPVTKTMPAPVTSRGSRSSWNKLAF